MERNTQKSNVMVNSTNNTTASVHINGGPPEELPRMKYLLETLSNYDTCISEIHTEIYSQSSDVQIIEDMQEQHQLSDQVQDLEVAGRIHLHLRVWDWTLLVKTGNSIHAFVVECFLKLPRISFWENKTTDHVPRKVICHVGRRESLRANIKRRKMV